MPREVGRVHALTTPFVPFAFPGEARVDVALAGGPTHDFNLMLRRARARGAIDVWRDAGLHVTDTATMLVYCARGTINSTDGMLHPGDAWRPSSAAATLDLQSGALALVVRVEDVTRSEERRGGEEGVRTCSSRGGTDH